MKILLCLIPVFLFSNIKAQELPVRFFVASQKVECENGRTCYQIKYSPDGQWSVYSGEIRGFQYVPGYIYELSVRKKTSEEPGEGGLNYYFELVEIISEKQYTGSTITQADSTFIDNKIFILNKIRKGKMLRKAVGRGVDIMFDLSKSRAVGNDGCNTYSGTVMISERNISFTQLATSRMSCPDVTINTYFHEDIQAVDNFRISGKYLRLYCGNELMLEFMSY